MVCVRGRPAHRATILVVDDELEVSAIVAEALEEFGYDVLLADSGAQALALLHEQAIIDLLITDIRMPEMSGIELANLVAELYPQLRVILMSGYFVTKPLNRRLLRKPFRMNELELAVRAELEAISDGG